MALDLVHPRKVAVTRVRRSTGIKRIPFDDTNSPEVVAMASVFEPEKGGSSVLR